MPKILMLCANDKAIARKDGYFLHGPEGFPATRLCSSYRMQILTDNRAFLLCVISKGKLFEIDLFGQK